MEMVLWICSIDWKLCPKSAELQAFGSSHNWNVFIFVKMVIRKEFNHWVVQHDFILLWHLLEITHRLAVTSPGLCRVMQVHENQLACYFEFYELSTDHWVAGKQRAFHIGTQGVRMKNSAIRKCSHCYVHWLCAAASGRQGSKGVALWQSVPSPHAGRL